VTNSFGITLCGRYTIGPDLVFSGLDLTILAGNWTCLLGPSGVGKSTILRLILDLPSGGEFEGQVTASDGKPLLKRVSYMAQSDLLLPWLTVRENTVLGARLRGETPDMAHADRLLARVGLAQHAAKTPAELSGGMRQRAALARTLMEDRPVVLLDEPFSALDAATRADMQELTAEVLNGKTVLLVTHDPAEASRLGHRIVLMSTTGTRDWPPPEVAPIRAINDPATLACQAALLDHLRSNKS
jgi:putative hydroxymethylpyrimidine transport system ATP-binding protein